LLGLPNIAAGKPVLANDFGQCNQPNLLLDESFVKNGGRWTSL
jgi:hypothetical protein